jgi:inorganic phosphate transporter, PiT family
MSIITEYNQILFILAITFGIFMAWGIGANDVANAMGTSVGSKALTIKQAIFIAIIFEFSGAFLAGGEVTSTIRKGMVDLSFFEAQPELLVFGMLSSMLAASIWLLIASHKGWPVSTTHSIIGAIVGFSSICISFESVYWSKILLIVASWVVSPLLAGFISFLIFKSVDRLILQQQSPFQSAQKYIPVYMFLTAFFISMVTFLKGFKYINLDMNDLQATLYSIIFALFIALLGRKIMFSISTKSHGNVEKIFGTLMIFTACAMAFAHGSNDVANAIGPLAAVINTLNNSQGIITANSVLPQWILLLGASGIVLGLATLGFKVIITIGKKITKLTPSRGFAAELAASATVVLASGTGIPISTTHTLVGAVLGVGLAIDAKSINYNVIGSIFASWLITLPVGAGLSIIFFYIFSALFTL